MKTYILSLTIISAMLFGGCNSRQDKDNQTATDGHGYAGGGSNEDDADEGQDHSDEILFTQEQAAAVGLTIETVTPGTFHQVIKTSGQIQSTQGDEATIVATSNGIVSFVDPSFSEGVSVNAGEAIVIVSARNLQDGDPAIKARIEYETAEKEFQRAQELVKDQIISAKEFEQSRLRYETAKTVHDAQARNVTANGVRVASPIKGFIINRLVSQGDFVSVGQPIATVSQNKRLQLRAEVSENYYKSLKTITSANFKTSYDDKIYKLSELNGRLLSFGKSSGQSFYVPVNFEFDNTGDIIPGSYAEVFLISSPEENIISVPVSSLTEEQGLYFVYLQLDDEGYKRQEVTLGQNNGERVRIISGLNQGDRVVTKGVYQVKLAAISSIMPEGHSH